MEVLKIGSELSLYRLRMEERHVLLTSLNLNHAAPTLAVLDELLLLLFFLFFATLLSSFSSFRLPY